jgi:hypothetical protein
MKVPCFPERFEERSIHHGWLAKKASVFAPGVWKQAESQTQ